MRSIFTVAFLVILIAAKHSFAQTDERTFNSMSFFYIDNSNDTITAGLNNEVKQYLQDKLKEEEGLKNNYFYLFAADGDIPFKQDNITNVMNTDTLTRYLYHRSFPPNYNNDQQTLRTYFTKTPVKIEHEFNVYLFLSTYAINRMVKEMNLMPTPFVFPSELVVYLNRQKHLDAKITVITNKEVNTKYTADQVKYCFSFADDKLTGRYIDPLIIFK